MNTSDTQQKELSGKKVLITGGLGFIGSNLAHKCLALGADVTIYDCLDPRSGGNMHNIKNVENKIKVALNDIRNIEDLSANIRDKDILFNCAAYTSHPNSMKEPLMDIEVNCQGVINILEAVRRFNTDIKIVQVGTSTQIGRMKYNPVDEDHPEFPVEIYSANKSVSEKYVLIYGQAYDIKTTVIRLVNVFGPRSNIKNSDFGFMNYFIGLALQGKELNVFGEGEQLRSLLYVDDAVDALILAALSEKSNGEVFLASTDQNYKVREIAEAITSCIGGTIKFVAWPKNREVIEIGDAVISNKKIKDVLNWNAQFDLNSGLITTREYFLKNLKQYLN
ncbi:MAG: SDR family NAD(P)-dependent oxidoreductase [Flavobacteriales bacterium]|nr:SDR family NAD(P)-dependent oxidoreductase [Flavobacteriales bacterium]